MSATIDDEAAIAFSSAFYLAIASGRNLRDAFDLGVNELMLQDIPEEKTPKLLVRQGGHPMTIIICKKITIFIYTIKDRNAKRKDKKC